MLEFKPAGGRSSKSLWWLVAFIGLISLVPILALGRAVVGRANLTYELTPSAVVIHYAPANLTVPRQEITGVQVFDRLTEGRRVMGTGMPGLYQGKWSFRETGRITLYASVQQQIVVLQTADGPWGLTPADPEGFVRTLNGGGTGRWAPATGNSPTWFVLPISIGIIAAIGLALCVLIYYIRLPATIRYALTDEAVLIEGGRLRVALPYRAIDQVTLANPRGGPWRKFGAELPGLLWGSFAWKDAGPNLRIYATQRKPLVLISSGGATYGISPIDADRFVSELKKRAETR